MSNFGKIIGSSMLELGLQGESDCLIKT